MGFGRPLVDGLDFVASCEWVFGDEAFGLFVAFGDESIEFGLLDAPLTTSADLDGPQITGTDQCVRLRSGDVQHFRDIGKGEKARNHPQSLTLPALSDRAYPFRVDACAAWWTLWTIPSAPGNAWASSSFAVVVG